MVKDGSHCGWCTFSQLHTRILHYDVENLVELCIRSAREVLFSLVSSATCTRHPDTAPDLADPSIVSTLWSIPDVIFGAGVASAAGAVFRDNPNGT